MGRCGEAAPLHKLRHQLAAWKRVRARVVLRDGQRTITSFLTAAPPPNTVVPTRTAPDAAPSSSAANRQTQTTIPFARVKPAAARLGSTSTDRQAPPPSPPTLPLSRTKRPSTSPEGSEYELLHTDRDRKEPRATAKKSQALRRQGITHAHCPRRSHHREATLGPQHGRPPCRRARNPSLRPAPPPPPRRRPSGVAPPASAGNPHSPRPAKPSTSCSMMAGQFPWC